MGISERRFRDRSERKNKLSLKSILGTYFTEILNKKAGFIIV